MVLRSLDPLSRFLLVTLRESGCTNLARGRSGPRVVAQPVLSVHLSGPPAPTPRPPIKHGTHVVKRNRNRYCYRSDGRYEGHWSNLLQWRRDTIHLVSYVRPFFPWPDFSRGAPSRVARVTPIDFLPDRSRNRMVPRARTKCVYVAQMLSREAKREKKNPQLRRTVFLFKRSESEGREGGIIEAGNGRN